MTFTWLWKWSWWACGLTIGGGAMEMTSVTVTVTAQRQVDMGVTFFKIQLILRRFRLRPTFRLSWNTNFQLTYFFPLTYVTWTYATVNYTVFQKHVTTSSTISWTTELSFYKIFGTKTIGHRQMSLFSHFTYLVQLFYLVKLSRPK